jgi:hypothetical protein
MIRGGSALCAPRRTLASRSAGLTEAQLHRSVAAYLRLALRAPTIWTTIGHGGGGRVRGGILKGRGVQPGWPDILVVHAGRAYGIELKAKKGSQSPEQKMMQAAFNAAGMGYCVCRSVEEVEEQLWHVNIPLHASLTAKAAA